MKLLTKAIEARLRHNRQAQTSVQGTSLELDHYPVVKFFTPDGGATWLISEMYDDGDTLFGLCDLGLGCAELGNVSLSELKSIRGKFGLPIERDKWFKADKTLNEYALAAKQRGRIDA
jgi:hypothetical protein